MFEKLGALVKRNPRPAEPQVASAAESAAPPTLAELYAMYGYTPPDAAEKVPRKKLDFEWSTAQIEMMVRSLNSVLDRSARPHKELTQTFFLPNYMALEVSFSPVKRDNIIKITLIDRDQTEVAALIFGNRREFSKGPESEDIWVLKHRVVAEKYRGQEIGSKMLSILEQGVGHIAQKTGRTQTMEIVASELGVINFCLKNGYEPTTDEDRANLDLVYSGDVSKVAVVTMPGFGNNGVPRPGYMYRVSRLKELARNNGFQYVGPNDKNFQLARFFPENAYDEYFTNSLMIRFQKETKPAGQSE